jgi:hypothetical protein
MGAHSMFLWIKKKFSNYISKLAKANEESFGDKQLDCCKIGKSNTKK